VLIPPPVV